MTFYGGASPGPSVALPSPHSGFTQDSHLSQVQVSIPERAPHPLEKKRKSNNYSLFKTWILVLNNYQVLGLYKRRHLSVCLIPLLSISSRPSLSQWTSDLRVLSLCLVSGWLPLFLLHCPLTPLRVPLSLLPL